jgi:hypothetical protein
MNELEINTANSAEGESGNYGGSPSSMDYRPPSVGCDARLAELEIENSRLHRLVAELLVKNQELRKLD